MDHKHYNSHIYCFVVGGGVGGVVVRVRGGNGEKRDRERKNKQFSDIRLKKRCEKFVWNGGFKRGSCVFDISIK